MRGEYQDISTQTIGRLWEENNGIYRLNHPVSFGFNLSAYNYFRIGGSMKDILGWTGIIIYAWVGVALMMYLCT